MKRLIGGGGSGGGSGTPGGSTTQVQFNDAGAFGGDADLTWDKTTNVLGITGDVNLSDGGTYTTTLQTITPTAARTISFPDATGTVALVAGSSGQLLYNNAGANAGASTLTYDGSILTSSGRFINSYNAAAIASAPAKAFTGTWYTSGTATTTKPHLLIEPTGTTSTGWSVSGTGFGVNAASTFTGNLLDLQVNGTSVFKIAGSTSSGFGIESSQPYTFAETSGALPGNYIRRGFNAASSSTDTSLYSSFIAYRSRAASPVNASGYALGAFETRVNQSSNVWTLSAYVRTDSTQAHSNTALGTRMSFGTTPNNSTTVTERFGLEQNGLISLGGNTSSFPALKRNSAVLETRLADDSAYAQHAASVFQTATAHTVATLPGTPAVGMVARVTDATAPAVGVTVVGGGAAAALVWYNGANWSVIGV